MIKPSESYAHDIINSSPDAIFIINKAGKIVGANQHATELFGYSSEEFIDMGINCLIPKRYREKHDGYISHGFDDMNSKSMRSGKDFRVVAKNNQEFPVEISINYTLYHGEHHAIAIIRDTRKLEAVQQSLFEKEQMLKKSQHIAKIGSWKWNLKGDSFIWSDEMCHIFNLDKDALGSNYDAFVQKLHPQDREEVVNALNSAIVLDTPLDLEHRILWSNKNERIVHLRGEVYRDENGAADHLIGTIHDITELKQTYDLRLADNVFNNTEESIMVMDAEKKLLRINRAFSETTGYSAEESIGKNPFELLESDKLDNEYSKELWEHIHRYSVWKGEIWCNRKGGEHFPSFQNISSVKDNTGKIIQYISIFSDITHKKNAEEYIENLAQYDQLTKLPNRMLFNDRLEQAFLRSKRTRQKVGIMFIDLDRFKSVNDTLGHQAGDQLLQVVSERLTGCIRQQDTVARLGGDEFTVILEGITTSDDIAIVADKILKSLSQSIALGEHHVTIGGSIGISVYPDDASTTENMIKNADMAMYQSKHLGKNRYTFYTDELSNLAEKRFHTENRLRKALEINEFELYYQPQIDVVSGNMIGAEALIRWCDKDRGIISPNDFIPLAEEMGLMNGIGSWVLEQACGQNKQWQEQGYPPIRISVNLSGYQIAHSPIVDIVKNTLQLTELSPQYLELEILENFVMKHPEKGIQTIKALGDLGVLMAIDDFGTGYSSLNYLKQLDIDRLKIDRSFVMDIQSNKEDKAIVSTIIAMAQNLGLSVIAEGVEFESHIEILKALNCFEMQGYYYSKPVPAKEFVKFFAKKVKYESKNLTSFTSFKEI